MRWFLAPLMMQREGHGVSHIYDKENDGKGTVTALEMRFAAPSRVAGGC
jgi:hypothetical protein